VLRDFSKTPLGRLRVFVAIALCTVARAAFAEAAPEASPLLSISGAKLARGGVLWTVDDGDFTLADLAAKAAPVLWLSPDEPLFSRNIRGPQPIPGDDFSENYVVYYSIDALVVRRVMKGVDEVPLLRDTAAVWSWNPGETSARAATRLLKVAIRYFFYYPQDVGFRGHTHDLEGAEMHIELTSDRKALRLTRVAASAHGVSWLTNELKITEGMDVVIPPHLFVEEGKHATAPDREGDAVYRHGHDVNSFLPDSWGVRDKGRLRQLRRFHGSMFKSRSVSSAVLPPSLAWEVPEGASTYALRDSGYSSLCRSDIPELAGYADYMRACAEPTVSFKNATDSPFMRAFRRISPHDDEAYNGRPYTTLQMAMQSFKYDGINNQIVRAMPLTRVPGLDGWLVVRQAVPALVSWKTQLFAQDLLYSNSVAQLFDGYGSIGWEDDSLPQKNGRVAYEAGVKIHVPFPGYQRVLPPLVTFRAGIRTSKLRGTRHTRWVYEFGFGPW
jgi:hypothetical protein